MYICIKNKKVCSIRIKIINKNNIEIIDGMYINEDAIIKYTFKNSERYLMIVSIVENGIQIFKNRYEFVYYECDEYKLDDIIKITKKGKQNKINKKNIMLNFDKNIIINPLVLYRNEKEKLSVFVNGNILLLGGNLKKIFMLIKDKKELKYSNLTNEEIIKYINILIMKGCVIYYE